MNEEFAFVALLTGIAVGMSAVLATVVYVTEWIVLGWING